MPDPTKRTFASQAASSSLRLVKTSKIPSLDEITPAQFARLNPKQRKEMVSKLIEFLKSV